MTQTVEAPIPSSIYGWYRQAVRVAIQQKPEDWTFKRDDGYRQVLEHVDAAQGRAFLDWCATTETTLDWEVVVRLANLNDSFGAPFTADYPGLGQFSPSNWRYLCHALKVWRHIDNLGLEDVDIIELGGGYGGLALYVRGLAAGRDVRLGNYTLVDLPEASILQVKFAAATSTRAQVINGLDADSIGWVLKDGTKGPPRLLVSAYAFSEFDQEMRDWYAERLIRHCEHGLIVWNCPDGFPGFEKPLGGPVYQFIDQPLTVEPDLPPLYVGHQLVTW